MAAEKVTIIGTGLIGSSIGLALKAGKLTSLEVVGHDLEADSMKAALQLGAVDTTERHLEGAVAGAKMIILATPPLAVRPLLEDLAELASDGTIITDVSSTKADIMRWADDLLPDSMSFVGGHPMAGKEESGPHAADASLFRGKAYVVIPSPKASEAAIRSVLRLVEILGAEPVFLGGEEHDQYVASISHMPLVLSAALFSLVRTSPAWSEISGLASSGFRDMTRLASGDPQMSHDICVTNPEGVVHWLDRMIGELRRYKDLIMDNHEELYNAFSTAQIQRDAFLAGTDRPLARDHVEMPSPAEQINSMVFGGWISNRMKNFEKRAQGANRGEAHTALDSSEDE